jgi:polyisoprenyl-phosphate glycosyltransferase
MRLEPFGIKPEITVVVPCFNEEAVLPETTSRLTAALEEIGLPFEIIFVDDGSKDDTARVLADVHAADPRIRVVRLSRNFGHQVAISAGLEFAHGSAVVLIDADLQDPPEVIPEMVAMWRKTWFMERAATGMAKPPSRC